MKIRRIMRQQSVFSYICTIFQTIKMKKSVLLSLACLFCLFGCKQQGENAELLQRSFYNTMWERFDYVRDTINIKEATTYDLSLRITFTDDYPYDYFSMVFAVLDEDGSPYRAKGYKFNLKDNEGHWNSEKKDDCYTFDLPINKQLQFTDTGKYQFKIEQKMPKTPLVGVKKITLINNNLQ